GHEPPAGSAFCNGCGAKLAIACPSCGATAPPGSRFCNGCGTPLVPGDKASAPGPTPAPHEERKVISILFADLMGSTGLQERLDGEVLIGPATRRLVANAVTLERAGVFNLKGRADAVTAYRITSLERPGGAATAAFVGRDDELAQITAVYEATLAAPAARL